MAEQRPDVTVIVGAYNAMPYLMRCLSSVMQQSLGAERVEIVTVDDGSTDSTGKELERLSAEYPGRMTVVRQENSGGPSAPRNVGLDRANGRYVFFLDADDYLGVEALERMVATADENASDVVLGRMVGVGGRKAPTRAFRRNQPRTNVFDSSVYWTLNPMKLFRRDLVERLGLRFRTDLTIGEDQPFTATAYLHAEAISVVADYDCVYWVAREDGGNITSVVQDTESRLRFLTAMTELVSEHTEPGDRRDHLMRRHLSVDLWTALGGLTRDPERDNREKALRTLQSVLAFSATEGVVSRLSARDRLCCHLIERGELDALMDVVRDEIDRGTTSYGLAIPAVDTAIPLTTLVEDGRVYARYPHFRGPALGVPDHLYDITDEVRAKQLLEKYEVHGGAVHLAGWAYLAGVSTEDPCTSVLLRERNGRGREFRLPVTPVRRRDVPGRPPFDGCDYSRAGFEVAIDPAFAADGDRLPDGLWDVYLTVGAQGVTREIRLGARRIPDVATDRATMVLPERTDSAFAVTAYFTVKDNLTLDVGEQQHRVLPLLGVDEVSWSVGQRGLELFVAGRCAIAESLVGGLELRAVHTGRGGIRRVPVEEHSGDRFAVRLPVGGMAGDWALSLRLGREKAFWSLPVPPGRGLAPRRWRRYGLTWYGKEVVGDGEAFVLRVVRVSPLGAAKRLLRR